MLKSVSPSAVGEQFNAAKVKELLEKVRPSTAQQQSRTRQKPDAPHDQTAAHNPAHSQEGVTRGRVGCISASQAGSDSPLLSFL